MADIKGRKLLNGYQELLKAVEDLGHVDLKSFDFSDEKIDIQKIRREEARLAAAEIAAEKQLRHKNYVASFYSSGVISPEHTFEKVTSDNGNTEALNSAKTFCQLVAIARKQGKNHLNKADPSLYLLCGGPGTGKTVISSCIANECLNRYWMDVEICSYADIKKRRIPSKSDNSYDVAEKNQFWERYLNVDLLIIDGFCQNSENMSVFDQQVMTELLRYRCSHDLPLVITTPVIPNAMKPRFGEDVFESLKSFSVITGFLLGGSRRNVISFGGQIIR